ncbi:MAG: T9SS type A sorting domain-containing protein [Calditrichaeota bacterium]|nr:T9SS type A sorting domain-containing protein [Calditrichota bacterium]
MKKHVLIFLVISIIHPLMSQVLYNDGHISLENQEDWHKAGLIEKGVRVADNLFNVQDAPADFQTDDEKIEWAISQANKSPGFDIIYLPGGVYTFNKGIKITQGDIVFQGDGADKTILKFYNDQKENCFLISGYSSDLDIRIKSPVVKGEKQLQIESIAVTNADILKPGDWINFYEAFFPVEGYKETSNNYYKSIGQVNQIIQVDGNTLELKDRVSRTNDISSNNSGEYLSLFKIVPVENVGIEDLTVQRATPFGTLDYLESSNFYFIYAINCWLKGIESDLTICHHAEVVFSSHIEISGCYFHEARRYAGGGYGYGVNLKRSTTNCLIENNIFRKLRHAMVIQAGANCNVFTYNYSYDQYSTEYGFKTTDSDLTIHGRYPFGNLFEQNHVEEIECDDSHQDKNNNGPYNTFLRNVARDRKMSIKDTEKINLLGNVIKDGISIDSKSSVATDLFGKFFNDEDEYDLWPGYPHIYSFYWIFNQIIEAFFLYDVSYYYSKRPEFLTADFTFPSLGPALVLDEKISQNIPARNRKDLDLKTYNSTPVKPPLKLSLNGPRYLSILQLGTYSLDISGGSGNYKAIYWYYRSDLKINHWLELPKFRGRMVVRYGDKSDFSLRCKVIQSNGKTKTVEISIKVSNSNNESGSVSLSDESEKNIFKAISYPNPFNSDMSLQLNLPEESSLQVDIFNPLGQQVRSLASGYYSAGLYKFTWNGRDENRNTLNSGAYFIIIKYKDQIYRTKTLLLK